MTAAVAHMRTNSISPGPSNLPLKNLNTSQTSNSSIMTSPHNLEGITQLMVACQQGRTTDVKAIISKKKDAVRDRTRSEKVAAHFCAEGGSVDCLEAVLEADPRLINSQDEEGYTPMHLGVINGNKDVVKAFIAAKADLNSLDNEKHSLVHWATVCGELDILDILLSCGAPATTADIHLAHPIHYAAQMCGNLNGLNSDTRSRVQSTLYGVSPKKGLLILRRLIQHGVPIDVRDQDGRQPLLWAASAGSADAILSLVNAGAFVEAEDKDGLTAIHCAASRGHTDCLETLIALCGAEVDVIDKNGCTALFYAITLGHADCTELLLNFGAEPNRQDRKGRTPAHCGASKGQLETIKLYAKHGGNLWLRNVRGDLPLHEAVISRRKDLVTWLLSQRPDSVNAPNNDGRCPIHLAALNNNVEMVKILIDHHADVNPLMRTGKGIAMTPLDAAIHRGNSAVAKFLQLHGGLPANSLNDASLQRRLNRSMESQARSTSSLHGSQMGNHHEPSPDNEHMINFTPEVLETSIIHHYAHSISGAIVSETSRIVTSTPIMQGSSMQTDSRHYLRDIEVQVSEDFPNEADEERKSSISELTTKNLSAQSQSRKPEKKLRRKRSSREKSSEAALDSTDSDTAARQEKAIIRSSRRSRSRKSSDSSPTLKATNSDSKTSDTKTTEVENVRTGAERRPVDAGHTSSQESSDNYHNESEKFSELENVAIPSSESEIREEELQVIAEVHSRAEREISVEKSRPGTNTSGGRRSKTPVKSPSPEKRTGRNSETEQTKSRTPSGSQSRGRVSKHPSVVRESSVQDNDRSSEEEMGNKSVDKNIDSAATGEVSRTESRVGRSRRESETGSRAESNVGRSRRESETGSRAESKVGRSLRESETGSRAESRKSIPEVKSRSGSGTQRNDGSRSKTPSAGTKSMKSEQKSRTPSGTSSRQDKKEEHHSRTPSAGGSRQEKEGTQRIASGNLKRSRTPDGDSRISHIEVEEPKSPGRKSRSASAKSVSEIRSRTPSARASTGDGRSRQNSARSMNIRPDSATGGRVSRNSSAKSHAMDNQNESTETQSSQTSETTDENPPIIEKEYLEVRSENTNRSLSSQNHDDSKAIPQEDTSVNADDEAAQSEAHRPTIPFSEQRSESKDSETMTHSLTNESDDADNIIFENQLNQISLQEAAARRRSKSKSISQSPTPRRSVKRRPPPPPTNPNYLRTPKHTPPKTRTPNSDAVQKSGRSTVQTERSPARSEHVKITPTSSGPRKQPRSETKQRRNVPTAEELEEAEIRLQEELIALKKKGAADLNKYTNNGRSRIPTSQNSNKAKSQVQPQHVELMSNTVHVPGVHLPEMGLSLRTRNPSEGNRSNLSDELGISTRDSGYSDQVFPATSASEDQSKLKYSSRSTGSIRRRVLSKRPKSNTSAALRKSGALSSASKIPKTSRDSRKRFETTLAQRQAVLSQENGSEESTSHRGSATSEEDSQTRHSKRRIPRPRSKLTFSKGDDINNSSGRLSPQPKKQVDVATPISVTQAMQASMRKYHLERKIFQELLELKRLQIRAGKANEQVRVKRLSDGYKKAGLSINFRDYDGPYTFRNFEKYLYDQLRLLQANRRILPRFAPSDDLEKLSTALKKMNATKLPFLEDTERCDEHGDHSKCTLSTHRCHHAAHAYTGVPCAAYIGKGRRTGFLPRVDPLKAPGPTQNDPLTRNLVMNGTPGMKMIVSPRGEPDSPITLEVQQGTKTQVFALPSQSLDPTKNYYVSLSIRPTPTPPPNPSDNITGKVGNSTRIENEDNSGQLSAPPPPMEPDTEITTPNDITNNSNKLNQSF